MILFSLIFAHLIADFLLQPKKWIDERQIKGYKSMGLIYHCLVHVSIYLLVMLAYRTPLLPMITCLLLLGITHFGIDVWKSKKGNHLRYFLVDQAVHIAIIALVSSILSTENATMLKDFCVRIATDSKIHVVLSAVILATYPTGIVIGIITERWRAQMENAETLANAGKWIGMLERFLILLFVLLGKYEAVGYLITAKSLLRFVDKDAHTTMRTEYILIGTLLSFTISICIAWVTTQCLNIL